MREDSKPFRRGDIFKYLSYIGITTEDQTNGYGVSVIVWMSGRNVWSEETELMPKRMELIARKEEYEEYEDR